MTDARKNASTGTGVSADADTKRYSSWLPVYQGQNVYNDMDNMTMDPTRSQYCIRHYCRIFTLMSTKLSHVEYNEEADTENDIIQKSLKQWCNMNEMHKRMFRLLEILLSTVIHLVLL